jgi:hypothetical protein
MEPQSSLQCIQEHATGPYPKEVECTTHSSPTISLIFLYEPSHLRFDLPSGLFPLIIPTKFMYELFITWYSRSIGMVMAYELDGRGNVSIPDKNKESVVCIVSTLALGPTKPRIQRVPGALSPGVKMQRRKADDSPLCRTKNGGAVSPLPHTYSCSGA